MSGNSTTNATTLLYKKKKHYMMWTMEFTKRMMSSTKYYKDEQTIKDYIYWNRRLLGISLGLISLIIHLRGVVSVLNLLQCLDWQPITAILAASSEDGLLIGQFLVCPAMFQPIRRDQVGAIARQWCCLHIIYLKNITS